MAYCTRQTWDTKLHIRFLLFCFFMAQSISALASEILYTAEVFTQSQSREDRNKALSEALEQVIGRFVIAGSDITLIAALDNAASYVDQYQYVQMSGDTSKKSSLKMRVIFNKDALSSLLGSSNLAMWGEKRDKTLVWLVVEEGRKQTFVDSDQDTGIEIALLDAAMASGIPLLFPLMDLEEKLAISVTDIPATSPDKILAVSERYAVANILSGKLVKRRTCWRSEWTLTVNSKTEQWSEPCADLKANLMSTMQRVYKSLSVVYAVSGK